MEKKKRPMVQGTAALKTAFIATLAEMGWKSFSTDMYKWEDSNHTVGIPSSKDDTLDNWYMCTGGMSHDITYHLPEQWHEALKAFINWKQPVLVEPTWVVETFSCTDGSATKFSRDSDGEYASTWTQNQMLGKTSAHGIARTVVKGSLQIYSVRATPNSPVIEIGSWITAECTHMGNTPIQVEGFMVNDKNNLLIKTREFRTHGVGIENCKKVGAPVEKKVPLFTTDKELFVTEDGVEIYNEHQITWAVSDVWNTPGNRQISEPVPHEYCRQWELNKSPVWHLFSTKTKAQEYMDSKKSPEKPAPLMQVLLTQKEINKLKELLK